MFALNFGTVSLHAEAINSYDSLRYRITLEKWRLGMVKMGMKMVIIPPLTEYIMMIY